jgi:hypothetical protein
LFVFISTSTICGGASGLRIGTTTRLRATGNGDAAGDAVDDAASDGSGDCAGEAAAVEAGVDVTLAKATTRAGL